MIPTELITKTLQLRVIRPLYSEEIEKELADLKEQKEKEFEEKDTVETGKINAKSLKKLKRKARSSASSEFWKIAEEKYPNILTKPKMDFLFSELQKLITRFYNKSMTNIFIEMNNDEKFNPQSLISKYSTEANQIIKCSSISSGLNRKLSSGIGKSKFKQVKEGLISLPTARTETFPVSFYKSTANKDEIPVKKINLPSEEEADLTIKLPFPFFEINKEKKGQNIYKNFNILDKPGRENNQIDLLLSTHRRQRRKGWMDEGGTSSEIRRLMEGEFDKEWDIYLREVERDEIAKKELMRKVNKGKLSKDIKEQIEEVQNKYFEENNIEDWSYLSREQKQELVDLKKEKLEDLKDWDHVKDILKSRAKIGWVELKRGKRQRDRNIWFVNITITRPPFINKELSNSTFGGIDLGVRVPFVCAVHNSPARLIIRENEVFQFNKMISARNRQITKDSEQRIGRGKKNKFIKKELFNEKNDLFRNKIIERWANQIVKFFEDQKCGTVQIENLESLSNRNDDFFNLYLRGFWPKSRMMDQVVHKLRERGIKVKEITPAGTSRICSKCHIENPIFTFSYRRKNNFPRFKCIDVEKCKYHEGADYNAAKNIANPEIEKLAKDLNIRYSKKY
jgi:IS605 OrfB family transposase